RAALERNHVVLPVGRVRGGKISSQFSVARIQGQVGSNDGRAATDRLQLDAGPQVKIGPGDRQADVGVIQDRGRTDACGRMLEGAITQLNRTEEVAVGRHVTLDVGPADHVNPRVPVAGLGLKDAEGNLVVNQFEV